MKRFLVVVFLALFAALSGARAEGPDDQYVRIYNLIQEGDALSINGDANQALAKYVEAQTDLQRLKNGYPEWNVNVVTFRLNYLATKITGLTSRAAPPPAARTVNAPATAARQTPAAPSPATPATAVVRQAPAGNETELARMREQIRQLQGEKILLEAKLKEAFAAQPASQDPRELARAQERLKTLEKENELLKVTLAQARSNSSPAVDAKALRQAEAALLEANRKLGEQTDRANALALERKNLQAQIQALSGAPGNSTALEQARRELAAANSRLTQQTQVAARLAQEKQTLEARLKDSSANSDVVAALRAENQILKQQLAQSRTPSTKGPKGGKTEDSGRQLAAARAEIAALQSDKDILRLEKIALENRVKQLSSGMLASSKPAAAATTVVAKPSGNNPAPSVAAAPSASSRAEDSARIKQLERERDELLRKLDVANKELYGRKNIAFANRIDEMQNQIATLRARLEIFEARQVPYTTEELALFRKPETHLADTRANPNEGKKSVNELPPGSGTLVAEAHAYFASRRLDKAEAKYQEILRKDEKNPVALANLAAIQLERNHLPDAEKSVQRAIAASPEDAYSLSVLGQIKFREEKYDEALDALSRAAKIDPKNAEVQNYLGITLSQKGMRGPAEAALRKAVQLDPGYGAAHHNLAVVYASQQPPLIELARWHYQKSLAAGSPHNADLEKLFETKKLAETGQ